VLVGSRISWVGLGINKKPLPSKPFGPLPSSKTFLCRLVRQVLDEVSDFAFAMVLALPHDDKLTADGENVVVGARDQIDACLVRQS
jgi:hypothetical protein